MTGRAVHVLIVEDSPTVRNCLREALVADPDIVVVGEAATGPQAVELCRRTRPDVVTMDVVLPGMSGLAATEEIMARFPTPILIVSSGERSEAFTSYDAMAAGAVDMMEKPRGDASDANWGERLRATVKVVSRIRVVTRHHVRRAAADLGSVPEPGGVDGAARTGPPDRPAGPPDRPVDRSGGALGLPRNSHPSLRVVAVGASTGGPGAVVELLRALPAPFTVPILVVQHIAASEPFAVAFTDWLRSQVRRPVSYARGGELVATLAGGIVMAPPDRHLVVRNGQLRVTAEPERHSCRPSADTLFDSVAEYYGAGAAGCLLSGMGRDGATGLLAIRQAGGYTFAQDEASCVVYGMPREAVLLGAADEVLPPHRIADRLAALAHTHRATGIRWLPPS